MISQERKKIGFACAYTPLALIDAAGFVPYRILPMTDASDQAGSLLHDNMCPHVKRVLDRAMEPDLPELAGVVFMNSCDAMRRLADAWKSARPEEPVAFLDLPVGIDSTSLDYFAKELARLTDLLVEWGGATPTGNRILESIDKTNTLAEKLADAGRKSGEGKLPGGRTRLQELYNQSVTAPMEDTLGELERWGQEEKNADPGDRKVPVLLFGNMLPDPGAFELFEACGARVVDDDLCTGSRQLVPMDAGSADNVLVDLARGILERPMCARTLPSTRPGELSRRLIERVKKSRARGVVAHIMKFCDPYLARMPGVQKALRAKSIPLLELEGDCTLRSLGQHRTRLEAFVELLGGQSS